MEKAPVKRNITSRKKPYNGPKPILTVSEKKKTADKFKHTKDVIDFYIESSCFKDTRGNSADNRDINLLYDAYNNIIPEDYFHYVTNPLNSANQSHRNFPARLRPYSIIRPNVDLLLGEYDKRPKGYSVITTDSEALNSLETELHQAILNNIQQIFVNSVNEQGGETGQPTEQVEPPQKIKEKFVSNYKDERAVWGQISLDQVDEELNIDEELSKMFKDYVIAGEPYSYKGIEQGRAVYERVSPLDIDYDKSPDKDYVEDGSWVVRRKYMTPSDIITAFYDEIKKSDIDNLESTDGALPFNSSYFNSLFRNNDRKDPDLRKSKIPVFHTVFKYYKKIGYLTFPDELGEMQEIEVPETYVADPEKGESVEWVWATVVWEGTRIDVPNTTNSGGDVEHLYVKMQEVESQRNVYNNISSCKLPYNGFRFSDTHSENTSIVELGLPYQILYIILHYRLELTIAKSKGKIALLDINAIPKNKDWNEEKFFYWAEANNFGLLDRNQVGVDKGWNQYQILDLSLYEHITKLIEVMEFVKREWDQLVGFTPQRKGQVAASETASGIDAARYQSSVISERMFTKFDYFVKRERKGLLDLTKFLNIDGKRAIHYGNDMMAQMVDIDGPTYMETEFDIHVVNSAEEMQNLNNMKQQAAAFASQGSRPSIIAEVIQAKSIAKLKTILKNQEQAEMEMAQQSEASKAEQEQRMLEIEKNYKQLDHDFETLLQEAKYDREERLEHIKGQYRMAENDFVPEAQTDISPAEIESNLNQREAIRAKERADQRKLDIEDRKVKSTEKIAREKIQAEKYKADKQYQIAKENKNQYDKKAAAKK